MWNDSNFGEMTGGGIRIYSDMAQIIFFAFTLPKNSNSSIEQIDVNYFDVVSDKDDNSRICFPYNKNRNSIFDSHPCGKKHTMAGRDQECGEDKWIENKAFFFFPLSRLDDASENIFDKLYFSFDVFNEKVGTPKKFIWIKLHRWAFTISTFLLNTF